jgi:PKD repeat protein
VYTEAGLYTVILTVESPGGPDTVTHTNYIDVDPATAVANFTASPLSGQAPLEVAFTNTSTGDYAISVWDFGDGDTSTEANPTHTYRNAGNYTVALTINGPGGTDTLTRTDYIEVSPGAVQASFSASPTQGIAPLTVIFTNTSTGDFNFSLWQFGDGGTSIKTNPTHLYEDAGIYAVILAVNGPGGTDTVTRTDYIKVYTPVQADFAAAPTQGPAPLTVVFTNTTTGDYTTSQWDFGDGNNSSQTHPSHTYIETGVYTVTLTVDGMGGNDVARKSAYITVSGTEDGDHKIYLPTILRAS